MDVGKFIEQSKTQALKNTLNTFLSFIEFIKNILLKRDARFLILSFGIRKCQKILVLRDKSIKKVYVPTFQDYRVLIQVFRREDYKIDNTWIKNFNRKARFTSELNTKLIIDLGANIGLSSLYFGLVYPGSTIILVEPSIRNMELAKRNTKSLDCIYMLNAISNKSMRVRLVDPGIGPDGFRVEVANEGEIQAITVNELLQTYHQEPFIIKIDIEGFESQLFSSNTEWFEKFAFTMIELHDWMLLDQGTSKMFLRTVGESKLNFIHRNEIIFCF